MPPKNPMTEGEALAVLRRLKDALPDVGLNGWMEGVHAVDVAISALTAHTAASGGEVVWPKRMVNLPCPEGTGDRIIGFRVPDGDPILGDYGLSEPLAWFRKVTIDRVTAPPSAVPADALERLVEQAMSRAQVFDDGSDGADAESAQSVMTILKQIAALIPKGAV